MENRITQLTRDELYQCVWSTPTRTLARELGISDVALGKICRKYHIPKPPPGYWRRRETGHHVKTPPLPPWGSGSSTIVIRRTIRAALRPEVQVLADAERSQIRPIVVDPTSTRRHAVLAARKKQAYSLVGRPLPSPARAAGISVTKPSLQRALNILSTFLWAAEERGFKIEISDELSNDLAIVVDGTPVNCRLVESFTNNPQSESTLGAPGLLVFEIQGYLPNGTRHRWSDRVGSQLEQNLNVVMAGLIVASEHKRVWKLDLEERTRRFEDAERRRLIEAGRRRAVGEVVEAWRKSCDLNAFLDAAEAPGKAREQPTDQWIAWARSYARKIDPLQNGQLQGMIGREFRQKSSEEG